jgi:transposase
MARFDLSDTQFSIIEPLLPPEHSGKQGHPYNEHRRIVNGILWILRTGAPWRDLPERYGPYQTCYDRLTRWQKDGTWDRVLSTLQTDTARADAQHSEGAEGDLFVDSTMIKAHPHAAGARKRTAKPLKKGAATMSALHTIKKPSAEAVVD